MALPDHLRPKKFDQTFHELEIRRLRERLTREREAREMEKNKSPKEKRFDQIVRDRDLYLKQWKEGEFQGPAFFVQIDSKIQKLIMRSKDLCYPTAEPIAVWISNRKEKLNLRPMLIVIGEWTREAALAASDPHECRELTRYYLYPYAGEMASLMFAVEIRVATESMLEVTQYVDGR